MTLRRDAIEAATGATPAAPPFPWHDRGALAGLLSAYRFQLELTEHHLAFTGSSPESFLDDELRDHPLWVTSRSVLKTAGRLERLREQALEILASANEDPHAFRVTSSYVVATAWRPRNRSR